jgi:hypothetical protein
MAMVKKGADRKDLPGNRHPDNKNHLYYWI